VIAKLNILALWVLSSLTAASISIAGTNAPPNIVYIRFKAEFRGGGVNGSGG
jgi:hypothetical protein